MGFAQVLFGSQSGGRLFRGRSITRMGTGGTGGSLKQTGFSSSALEAQAYSRESGKKNINIKLFDQLACAQEYKGGSLSKHQDDNKNVTNFHI